MLLLRTPGSARARAARGCRELATSISTVVSAASGDHLVTLYPLESSLHHATWREMEGETNFGASCRRSLPRATAAAAADRSRRPAAATCSIDCGRRHGRLDRRGRPARLGCCLPGCAGEPARVGVVSCAACAPTCFAACVWHSQCAGCWQQIARAYCHARRCAALRVPTAMLTIDMSSA